MTNKPKRLSDAARVLLTAAATRDDHLMRPPQLPGAAAQQVVRSLLNAGLVEEVPTSIDSAGYAWRTHEAGGLLVLRATRSGLACISHSGTAVPASSAVAIETSAIKTSTDTDDAVTAGAQIVADLPIRAALPCLDAQDGLPCSRSSGAMPAFAEPGAGIRTVRRPPARSGRRSGLRQAAQALLDAWDQHNDGASAMTGPVADLRAALALSPHKSSLGRTRPRPATKQTQVLAMLRRAEGASGPQIADAMGWEPHTVRGFLASLAKRGINVDVLERVRQVGPHGSGAKGSYTIYRLGGEAER